MKLNINVLTGRTWVNYMDDHNLAEMSIEDTYVCTHNYHQIYKIGEYFFAFAIRKGYKNVTALKRLLGIL